MFYRQRLVHDPIDFRRREGAGLVARAGRHDVVDRWRGDIVSEDRDEPRARDDLAIAQSRVDNVDAAEPDTQGRDGIIRVDMFRLDDPGRAELGGQGGGEDLAIDQGAQPSLTRPTVAAEAAPWVQRPMSVLPDAVVVQRLLVLSQ